MAHNTTVTRPQLKGSTSRDSNTVAILSLLITQVGTYHTIRSLFAVLLKGRSNLYNTKGRLYCQITPL